MVFKILNIHKEMMIRLKLFSLILCFLTLGQVFAQTTSSVCYIHRIKSQNEKYYLVTIPYDNIDETSLGKTIVFDSDSNIVYEINRHFEYEVNRNEIFLSNDGQIIAYVLNREFEWEGTQNYNIEIFKNGISVKQMHLNDLINCNCQEENCYLFYKEAIDSIYWNDIGHLQIKYKKDATDFEKQLTEKATFLNNDTLLIFTKTSELISLDLNTLSFTTIPLSDVNPEKFIFINPFQSDFIKFEAPQNYRLPNLSNGLTLKEGLAKRLNMVLFDKNNSEADEYKEYFVSMEIVVDKNGNAVLVELNNRDNLPKDKIEEYISLNKFATNSIPFETEKWRFNGYFSLMDKSKLKARQEKKKEIIKEKEAYKMRIVADSIQGFYIPKNIEECFTELDKLLKPKDIKALKSLKEEEVISNYHHGLGTYLRNNWYLWGGSRLSNYFKNLGIFHPDDISSIILRSYYRYLNQQEIKLDKQIKYYKDYWAKYEVDEKKKIQEQFSQYKVGDTLFFNYPYGFVSLDQENLKSNYKCQAKGILIEKNNEKLIIKVRLIESCDRKGIIYYDNKDSYFLNEKTKKWEKPKRRIIKKMKENQEKWTNFESWGIEK